MEEREEAVNASLWGMLTLMGSSVRSLHDAILADVMGWVDVLEI